MTSAALWAFLAATLAAQADPYQWPLDLPRLVTSSFGEFRAARFHAGIDLRTGAIGKQVRAAGDGYVSRLRCSPWGYGKAVYLTLRDGHTVIYGHLDGFAPPLDEYVRKAQHDAQSYTVDLTPEANALPVKKGQLIARSGDTGIGVPHLHYEIRDATNDAINPRLLGISWPDNTRPIIQRLVIQPAGPDSSVNGTMAPVMVSVGAPGRDGTAKCRPIEAKGRILFGVDVVDPANNNENKLGVHTLRVRVGDDEIFRVVHDRMSYANRQNGAVAYHPFLADRGPFMLLWLWPGNVCDFYAHATGDGCWAVPETPAQVRIEALDFFGNATAAILPIRPAKSGAASPSKETVAPSPPTDTKKEGAAGRVELACVGGFVILTATFDAPEAEPPELTWDGLAPAEGGSFRRAGPAAFEAGYLPAADARQVTLHVRHPRLTPYDTPLAILHRGDRDRVESLGPIEAHIRSDSPYGVLFLAAEVARSVPAKALPAYGEAWRVWPEASPIDAPVDLAFPIPNGADPNKLDVYRATGERWAPTGAKRVGDRLVVSTQQFGVFQVMADTAPPEIDNLRAAGPRPAKKGATLASPRPSFSARVRDVGSGILRVDATCGGQWLLMEYDPEEACVRWAQDEDLPAGERVLTITARDNAGNETTATHTLAPPQPATK